MTVPQENEHGLGFIVSVLRKRRALRSDERWIRAMLDSRHGNSESES